MADAITIAKKDLLSLTKFQHTMYQPNEDNENDVYESRFLPNFRHGPWSSHLLIKMSETEKGKENKTCKYFPDMKFDYLCYTFLRIKLPFLKVRDKFASDIQISWPRNIGINIIKRALIYHTDTKPQEFDRVSLNILFQTRTEKGDFEEESKSIGNIPELISWSRTLPEWKLNVNQPWYFSTNHGYALPLFLFTDQTYQRQKDEPICFEYEYELDISKLLRMRLKVPEIDVKNIANCVKDSDGTYWKYINFRSSYLEEVPKSCCIPIPEMWGRHSLLTDTERDWIKEEISKKPLVMYIEDMFELDSTNDLKFGSDFHFNIDYDLPVREINFVAENMQSSEIRNLSNYSTSIYSHKKAYCPIKYYEFSYFDNTKRVKKCESDFGTHIEHKYHSLRIPTDPGYCKISFGYGKQLTPENDVSCCFKKQKARLTVVLGDNNPYINSQTQTLLSQTQTQDENITQDEDLLKQDLLETKTSSTKASDVDLSNSTYTIHVRTNVIKRLEFTLTGFSIQLN